LSLLPVILYSVNNEKKKFIACGMYAFSDDLAESWQQLFACFTGLLDASSKQAIELRFDSDQSLLRDPGLFFGHTCGYPLMKHLKDRVTPFCVPVFDPTESCIRVVLSWPQIRPSKRLTSAGEKSQR
jgi:hypothetical protein